MHRNHVDNERSTNPLLLALKRGGPMHHVIASAGSFDAVLLPSTSVIQQAGLASVFEFVGDARLPSDFSAASPLQSTTQASPSGRGTAGTAGDTSDHPASWFLLCHLIRFDNRGMSPNFCTLAGQRGAFSDSLDTVARGGLIGRRVVLGHLDPLPAQTQDAYRAFLPQSLNIFVVDGVMVDDEVVKECIHKAQVLRQQTNGVVSTAGSGAAAAAGGVLGSFGSGVASWVAAQVRSGKDAAASTTPTAPTASAKPTSPSADQQPVTNAASDSAVVAQKSRRSASEQELAIQYPEFQRLMLLPASAHIAKALHTFVDHVVLDATEGPSGVAPVSAPSSASNRKGATHPPSAAAVLSKEIRGFVQQMVAQIQKLSVWKGKELIAREGMEKYICSKLYNKLFATSWSEKQKDATLKRKLSLLNAVVGPQNLDGPEGVELAPHWQEAVAYIRGMNDYRSPRDKMDAAVKCCAAIQKCVAFVRNSVRNNKGKRQEDKVAPSPDDNGSSSAPQSPPPEVNSPTRNGSFTAFPGGLNLGGADEFLPTLILCVLRANPDSLCSNLVYIDLFRDKSLMEMSGEYDLTSLQSSCEFWLTCQAAHLRLSEEAFDTAMGNVFAKITPRTTTSGIKQRGEQPATAGPHSASLADCAASASMSSKSIVDALFDVGVVDHSVAQHSVAGRPENDDSVLPSLVAARVACPAAVHIAHVGVQTDVVDPIPDRDDAVSASKQRITKVVDALAGLTEHMDVCDVPFENLTVSELQRMWTDMRAFKAQCAKVVAMMRGPDN